MESLLRSLLTECDEVVSKPDDLKAAMKGVTLAKDSDGFYVRTHRGRSKSYESPYDIPKSKIDWVESTG